MPTRLNRACAATAVSIGLFFAAAPALPAMAASQVTASQSVNVRSAPDTASQIVGGLYRGQTVEALSETGGWTEIRYPGVDAAYVFTAYLVTGSDLPTAGAVSAGATRITTTNVNLRKGAGLSYEVITVLKEGVQVTLTGKTARGFSEVVNASSTGWVSTQYLTDSASGLPAVTGTRVATADLAVRTTSGTDARTVAEVQKGTSLGVTGATANGRAQIVYNNAIRWVTARYLANPATNLPAPPTLPKVTGTRYATATLDLRSSSANSSTKVGEVSRGTQLSITGVVENAQMQIVYDNAVRWVAAKYLSTSAPSSSTPGSATVENGLTPNAVKTYRAALAMFPQITTVYGVRPDTIPDHPSGRALDLMIPDYTSEAGRQLGGEVAAWARANAASLGINYVIWDQQIWNIARDSEGWRYMASRGNDSANHKNHVHITVYPAVS